MDSIIAATLLLLLAATVSAQQRPLNHLSKPNLQWNQFIQSAPRNGGVVQISPDDKWLYVTSQDGTLSKLNPENGRYVNVFTPDRRTEDGKGGTISEDDPLQWIMNGGGGISFYMDEENGGVGAYLVYWVFDVPPLNGLAPSSRVVAIKHDDSEEMQALWSHTVAGDIQGTPVIGSEGKFVYLTMNSIPAPPSPPSNPPSKSPVAPVAPVITNAPVSNSPTASPVTNSPTLSPATNSPTPVSDANALLGLVINPNNPPPTVAPTASLPPSVTNSSDVIDTKSSLEPERVRPHQSSSPSSDGGRFRQLQVEKSGKFMILSHPSNGASVYEYDSRDELSITKHNFAPLEIARNPEYGNYDGGEANRHDILMWGSGRGDNARQGETLIFQLPKAFNQFDVPDADATYSELEVLMLESVSFSTETKPTFSSSGLEVYFPITQNSITGWNQGQKFDRVANVGPIKLPPFSADLKSAGRAIVITSDDSLLMQGSIDHNTMFVLDSKGGVKWRLNGFGTDSIFTTPRLSPDNSGIAYVGKANAVHAINITDGTMLWGNDVLWGYEHPSSTNQDRPMVADFSVSSSGEFLYYARTGSSISAIRVAEIMPTDAPTLSPSKNPTNPPTLSTSPPSAMPSVTSSLSPSISMMPSTSILPTTTNSPTIEVDPMKPSVMPTSSILPTQSPTATSSGSPSAMPTNLSSASPSAAKTTAPVTGSPVSVEEEVPSAAPSIVAPTPPTTGAVLPETETTENEGLSSTIIIAIAAGSAAGLIIIAGIVWYISKKRGEDDDGVDNEWQQSNTANQSANRDEGTTFQYADEEVQQNPNQNRKKWGEGDAALRW